MTDIHLLQCPFCGDIPEMEPWHGGAPTKVMISCVNDSGCSVLPQVTGETPDEAVEHWNRRSSGQPAANAKPVPSDMMGRLYVGKATSGDQFLVWKALQVAPIEQPMQLAWRVVDRETGEPRTDWIDGDGGDQKDEPPYSGGLIQRAFSDPLRPGPGGKP